MPEVTGTRSRSNGQIAAAIFLSKNLLGYNDYVNSELTGAPGGPIQIAAKPDFSQLNIDELKQLRTLTDKTIVPRRT